MTSVKKASRGHRGSQEKVGQAGQQLHEALWRAGAVFRGKGTETLAGSLLINELSNRKGRRNLSTPLQSLEAITFP